MILPEKVYSGLNPISGRMSDFKTTRENQEGTHENLMKTALRKQAHLIDLAPVAAIVRELDGMITFWSEGAERLYGWTKEDVLGRRTHDVLRTVFPERLDTIVAELMNGRRWSGELQHQTKDGRTIIVESHWLGEFNAQGQLTELLETNIDITERKRLQEHLEVLVRERTAQLERRNAELEAFSYSLSHDIRGPLRAIHGFAEVTLQDCGAELSHAGKGYLGNIIGSAQRLDRLIRDVLTLSRLSMQPLELTTVNIEELIMGIVHERPEFQAPSADVQIQGPIPAVRGQHTLLTQVFANLLENAAKFVKPGTKPQIRVWSEPAGDKVRVWIEDKGIGIDPQAKEQVFKLFGRNNRAKHYEGTGIGLAIVRKAVERLGGEVGVLSEPGIGSRFWVDLSLPERAAVTSS